MDPEARMNFSERRNYSTVMYRIAETAPALDGRTYKGHVRLLRTGLP